MAYLDHINFGYSAALIFYYDTDDTINWTTTDWQMFKAAQETLKMLADRTPDVIIEGTARDVSERAISGSRRALPPSPTGEGR